MPEQYEAMRDKFMREGATKDVAQERAAKIYNAHQPKGAPPVTGHHEGKSKESK